MVSLKPILEEREMRNKSHLMPLRSAYWGVRNVHHKASREKKACVCISSFSHLLQKKIFFNYPSFEICVWGLCAGTWTNNSEQDSSIPFQSIFCFNWANGAKTFSPKHSMAVTEPILVGEKECNFLFRFCFICILIPESARRIVPEKKTKYQKTFLIDDRKLAEERQRGNIWSRWVGDTSCLSRVMILRFFAVNDSKSSYQESVWTVEKKSFPLIIFS